MSIKLKTTQMIKFIDSQIAVLLMSQSVILEFMQAQEGLNPYIFLLVNTKQKVNKFENNSI